MATRRSEAPSPEPQPSSGKWRRWPCSRCGHKARRFLVTCPACEALPWTRDDASPVRGPRAGPFPSRPQTAGEQLLRPGVDVVTRGSGLFLTHHRFFTPLGYVGLLTRSFAGGADWLGADGCEWRIERMSVLGKSWILREDSQPIAAAELRGIWRGSCEIRQGDRAWYLTGAGIARRSFVLGVEDGPEVLRIRGGVVDPLHRIEVLVEAPLASAVLAAFLACGMRHGEGE